MWAYFEAFDVLFVSEQHQTIFDARACATNILINMNTIRHTLTRRKKKLMIFSMNTSSVLNIEDTVILMKTKTSANCRFDVFVVVVVGAIIIFFGNNEYYLDQAIC